jgi:NAD(P)-dependent dehydrogenase (short-subunit alcohol dehydrogenase family)
MNWTLVTGGAQGLGAVLCESLAAEGYSILVHYRHSQQEAENVADRCRQYGVESQTIEGDFSSLGSTIHFTEQCLKRFPGMKNLINNVGNDFIGSVEATTPEEWQKLFQVNVHAPFILSQAFLPMLKTSKGNIINIGVAGINQIRASVERPAYMAAKSSLLLLTKSLAKELASSQVRVNMVSPGYLENSVAKPKGVLPMDRLGTLEECARVVSFLLKEENGYITGQNIEVSGAVGL